MKTINNETAKIIQEFLENHKKVDMAEVKNIYDHIYSESGEFVYNSHLVMTDMDVVFENVKRCTSLDLCKYHMTILAILFEGCGIYPPKDSPFYEISNDNSYKFKILAKECEAIMKTKNISFIEAFIKGAYSSSLVTSMIINDGIDINNEDENELNKMREFDQIYINIFSSQLMKNRLDHYLEDTRECLNETIKLKFKSKIATVKLSEESMNIIYQTAENYGMSLSKGDDE